MATGRALRARLPETKTTSFNDPTAESEVTAASRRQRSVLSRSTSPRVGRNHSSTPRSRGSVDSLHERELLERFRHVYAGRGGWLHGRSVTSTSSVPWLTSERRYKQEILGKLAKNFSKKSRSSRPIQVKLTPSPTVDPAKKPSSHHSQISLQELPQTPTNREIPGNRVTDSLATSKPPSTYRSNYEGLTTKEPQKSKQQASTKQPETDPEPPDGSLCQTATRSQINDTAELTNRLRPEEPSSRSNSPNSDRKDQRPESAISNQGECDAEDGLATGDHNNAQMSRDIYPTETEMLQKYKASKEDGALGKPPKGQPRGSIDGNKSRVVMSQLSLEARKALNETREEMCTTNEEVDDSNTHDNCADNIAKTNGEQTSGSKPLIETHGEIQDDDVASTNSQHDEVVSDAKLYAMASIKEHRRLSPVNSKVSPRKSYTRETQDLTLSELKQRHQDLTNKQPKRQVPSRNSRPSKPGRLPQITSLDTSRLPRESDLTWNNKSQGLQQQGQYRDIPQPANMLLTRERTFKITPAGYDSRFNDIPIALIEEEIPPEIKVKAISKCSEWMNKYM